MAAKKSLGQHFLIDRRSVARIVRALGVRNDDPVLEIGPGRGALTTALVRSAGRIAAVELDATLAGSLRRRFGEDCLVLFEQDVLGLELAQVLDSLGVDSERRLLVVGNLPYNISKPVVRKLIRERDRVARAVLMFQREVAVRLTAQPGRRAYGPLTVLAGLAFRIETLFDLPPRAFSPAPRVVSTVTRWNPSDADVPPDEELRRLREVLQVSFASRRRTLRNNLRHALADRERAERLLEAARIDGALRAEAIRPAEFLRLAALWDRRALL
jgi:16S rRNA (adenine1518-N6/adenine1519-N6)-dimethyltransferase